MYTELTKDSLDSQNEYHAKITSQMEFLEHRELTEELRCEHNLPGLQKAIETVLHTRLICKVLVRFGGRAAKVDKELGWGMTI